MRVVSVFERSVLIRKTSVLERAVLIREVSLERCPY